MNTGLQDAHNLAWKLAFVIKGIAKDELLNTYNEERLPFAKALLNSTDKGFTFLAGDSFGVRTLRKYLMIPIISNLLSIQKFRTFAFKKISQIAYSYKKYSLSKSNSKQHLKFNEGDRIPYIEKGYYNNFKDPIFHLIRVSNSEISQIEKIEIKNSFPFNIKIIDNKISTCWQRFGVSSDLNVLVRPDQHILYISDNLDKAQINQHLEKYFNSKN